MKESINTRHMIRAVVFGLLAFTLPLACKKENSDDKPAAAVAASQIAQDRIGAWVHIGIDNPYTEVWKRAK